MKITEIKNTKIVLTGSKNPNDSKLDVEHCLPNNNHFGLFIGAAGSGKTSLVISLLTSKKFKSYRGVFDKIYLFSGSLNTLPQTFTDKLHEDRVFDNLDSLEEIMDELKQDEEHCKVLIIIDDLVKEIKQYEPVLKKLAYNRRHYAGGVSLWMITQKLKGIPLSLRVAVDNLFCFANSLKNKNEAIQIHEDFIIDFNKEQWLELINALFKTSPPYEFLYVNKVRDEYYKNFNKLVIE